MPRRSFQPLLRGSRLQVEIPHRPPRDLAATSAATGGASSSRSGPGLGRRAPQQGDGYRLDSSLRRDDGLPAFPTQPNRVGLDPAMNPFIATSRSMSSIVIRLTSPKARPGPRPGPGVGCSSPRDSPLFDTPPGAVKTPRDLQSADLSAEARQHQVASVEDVTVLRLASEGVGDVLDRGRPDADEASSSRSACGRRSAIGSSRLGEHCQRTGEELGLRGGRRGRAVSNGPGLARGPAEQPLGEGKADHDPEDIDQGGDEGIRAGRWIEPPPPPPPSPPPTVGVQQDGEHAADDAAHHHDTEDGGRDHGGQPPAVARDEDAQHAERGEERAEYEPLDRFSKEDAPPVAARDGHPRRGLGSRGWTTFGSSFRLGRPGAGTQKASCATLWRTARIAMPGARWS